MKIPDVARELDAVRRTMQAPLITWRAPSSRFISPSIAFRPIEQEISSLGELTEGDGGTILFGDRRVFLYIREFRVKADSFDEACAKPEDLRKFHVAWCETLQRMKDEGRFDRYVVSTKADAPFGVALEMPSKQWQCGYANLAVCRFCLRRLNWEGYTEARRAEKDRIVRGFSRPRFLATTPQQFTELPKRRDDDPFSLGYAPDWPERSRSYRQRRNWRCERCGVDCSNARHLLDTHHRSGVTSDNSEGNLQALCKLCHADAHRNSAGSWYRVSPDDEQAVRALWRSQGVVA